MNTFLYGPVPTLPNRATPQNTSEGEEAPHRFQTPGHAQLGTKQNDGPIYTPNGVHALLQRTNAKSTPTVTRVRKAPGTNLCFRACDAVPWKTSAQKAAEEAERVEAMRRRAAEEEEEKKKKAEEEEKEEEEVLCTQEEERKSLSSQLLPSFVAASRDAEKENAEGRVNVSDVKKRENDVKNASSAPLKTRVNDADADWKKQKAETADVDADFVRASLTPPKGGEKKARGENTSAGKRCVGSRDVSAALNAREGKKARVVVVGKRTKEKQNLLSSEQILLQRTRALGKQVDALSTRLETMEKFLMDTITARFEETNAFVFEVLTAVASTSRRADEQIEQTKQMEQTEQTEQIEQTEQMEHVASERHGRKFRTRLKKMR